MASQEQTALVQKDAAKEVDTSQIAYRLTGMISDGEGTPTPEKMKKSMKLVGGGQQVFQLHWGGRCGWTVMGTAAAKNNVRLIQFFYDHREGEFNVDGVDILNQGNEFGWTPLFCAVAIEPNLEAVLLLLKLGADRTLKTTTWCGSSENGNTDPNMTAKDKCHQKISALFSQKTTYLGNLKTDKKGFSDHLCRIHLFKEVKVSECQDCPKVLERVERDIKRYLEICDVL